MATNARPPRRRTFGMLYTTHLFLGLPPGAVVVPATVTKPLVTGRHRGLVGYSGGTETGSTAPAQRGSSALLTQRSRNQRRNRQNRKVGPLPNMPRLPIKPASTGPRQKYPARFAQDFAHKRLKRSV